jgi:hypothetical protein
MRPLFIVILAPSFQHGAGQKLLALPGTSWRLLSRMIGLTGLLLPVLLGTMTGLSRGPCLLLMCRVSMIVGSVVLGLVWGAFAIAGHEFSKFESHL